MSAKDLYAPLNICVGADNNDMDGKTKKMRERSSAIEVIIEKLIATRRRVNVVRGRDDVLCGVVCGCDEEEEGEEEKQRVFISSSMSLPPL